MTTFFSQRDTRWCDIILGTGQLTIGQAGCLLCCVASCLADHNTDVDPARLNQQLIEHQGYVNDNLLLLSAPEPLGLSLQQYITCASVPAPIKVISTALQAQQFVICEVDFTPGGTLQSHWVRILDTAQWLIMDPWQPPDAEPVTLANYFAAGWNAARAILSILIYTSEQPRSIVQYPVYQPTIYVLDKYEN